MKETSVMTLTSQHRLFADPNLSPSKKKRSYKLGTVIVRRASDHLLHYPEFSGVLGAQLHARRSKSYQRDR